MITKNTVIVQIWGLEKCYKLQEVGEVIGCLKKVRIREKNPPLSIRFYFLHKALGERQT